MVARGDGPGGAQLGGENFAGGGAGERFLIGKELVGGDAEGIDIGPAVEGFALELFRGHVARGAGVLGKADRFLGKGLCEVKVDEADGAVAGDEDVLGFEIEVHVAALVDVAEAGGHVDDDLGDVLGEDGVVAGVELLEVVGLDVVHGEVAGAAGLAVLDVADDVVAVIELGEDFAAAPELAAGGEAEAELAFEAAEGVGFAAVVGDEPDFGHAAGVQQFLEVETAEGLFRIGLGECLRHSSIFHN